MKVEQRPLAKIEPYGKNAKKHPEEQITKIADSIREFGFNQPLVVDKTGVLIVGHGRYYAAHLLGLEKVPVLELDISEEKARAYRLADNKLNESDWNMELVIGELQGLSIAMIDLTGFSRDLLLTTDAEDDDVPEVPKVAQTVLGDIYELGAHRVICGDSTEIDTLEKLTGGVHVDMLLTDPPYNVDYTGKTKNALKIENDKKDDSAFRQFLSDSFIGANAYMKPGAVFYIWHADSEGYNFRGACRDAGWSVRQCLIWNKNVMVMGRQDYHWKHEPCLYGWKDGAAHLWNTDRKQTTVLDFARPTRSEQHPTMKPVELLVYQMTNNTKGEDIVLDPFLGSGSTLIAAQKSGRVCHGAELDPKYVDVIVQRYVDFTGNTTIKKNGVEMVW